MTDLANPLFKSTYYNCSQLVISAMLLRQGISIEKVWKQAGLKYSKIDTDVPITYLFRDLFEDIKNYNGIEIEELLYPEAEFSLYIEKICEGYIPGKTFAVSLDVFDLPYCIQYQKEHLFHMIEVMEVEGEDLIISDHFYHYHGKLSKKLFEKAAYSVYKNTTCEKNTYWCIKTINDKEKNIDLMNVLEENLQVMEGNYSPIEFEDAVIGFQAIAHIEDNFKRVFHKNIALANEMLNSYFTLLKDVANSRYHLANFLKTFELEENKKEIIESYQDAYQCWTVLANLIAKMYVSNKLDGMEERVSKRFKRVYEAEKKVIQSLREYLETSIPY
ncbi:hypothetical protein [Bacillus cereus]|uniref:hypothetical protein n=1 Tax=Bacillus cereus TaxID=1396 RepID=UPI00065BD648|nr:hypothetical protein [Bacillus cereus]KMQ32156.1 hypothetical protein TU58_01325 [Bacillus cereus]